MFHSQEIRRKLLEAYHKLAKEKVDAIQLEGSDPKRYIKSLCKYHYSVTSNLFVSITTLLHQISL